MIWKKPEYLNKNWDDLLYSEGSWKDLSNMTTSRQSVTWQIRSKVNMQDKYHIINY